MERHRLTRNYDFIFNFKLCICGFYLNFLFLFNMKLLYLYLEGLKPIYSKINLNINFVCFVVLDFILIYV